MENHPLYPYRGTTGADGQAWQEGHQPSQYPQPQQPRQPQAGYPQAQAYPPARQPQGYPVGGYGYRPDNILATVALALGIAGTLTSLSGYTVPNAMAFIMVMCLAAPAIALGFVGIHTSKRMGGLRFGHALAGVILGASSVAMFLVLAAPQAGSVANIFTGGPDDDPAYIYGKDEEEEDDPIQVPSRYLAGADEEHYDLFYDACYYICEQGPDYYYESQVINEVVIDNGTLTVGLLGTGKAPVGGDRGAAFALALRWDYLRNIAMTVSNEEFGGVCLADEEPITLTDYDTDCFEVVIWVDEENLIDAYEEGSCDLRFTDADTGELLGEATLSL